MAALVDEKLFFCGGLDDFSVGVKESDVIGINYLFLVFNDD